MQPGSNPPPLVATTGPVAEFSLEKTRTERLGHEMAAQFGLARQTAGNNELITYLETYQERLALAHELFRQATQDDLSLTYASEWVLDNYYVLRQATRQIKGDLPKSYYRELPKLENTSWKGLPRVYALVRALTSASQFRIHVADIEQTLIHFQEQAPLTMGEIWAVPIFLRYSLIEALVQSLEKVINPRKGYSLPTGNFESQIQTDELIANAITGLRALSTLDWKKFFESVSLVERILRKDPVGVYAQMDFETRDLYRKAVEDLAKASHQKEYSVAQQALSLAETGRGLAKAEKEATRPVRGRPRRTVRQLRLSHVGYYLISDGIDLLETALEMRPSLAGRWKRWLVSHTAPVYLVSITFISLLFLGITGGYAARHASQPAYWIAALLVMLIPAISIATYLVNWLATQWVRPKRLPKMEFRKGVPPLYRTLVVIPALLGSESDSRSLARQLEMHYLRNSKDNLIFGLLTDFADAGSEYRPEDAGLLREATDRIQELNQRYRTPGNDALFYLFHRKRVWNPSEGVWMGWERKRGKLHELNQLLRGHRDLTFINLADDLEPLKTVRYVITLDADTVLPSGTARRLIGTLAHPLNQALFDHEKQEVEAGYTILQPRMEISPTNANNSWFARVFAGDTGLDLYSLAVSDVYQDLFGEGIYVGKGIYDIDAFERSVKGRIPENTLLSHDLLEGLLGRAGLVTDVTMVEEFPPHYLAYTHRLHRWLRGDWQLLPWLFAWGKAHAKFSAIDRWKMMDNLRRSLLSPALLVLLLLGWLYLPGSPLVWMALALITPAISVLTALAQGAREIIAGEPAGTVTRPIWLALMRWLAAIIFLPYESLVAFDAILTTLYRIVILRRNLLLWTPAAHQSRQWGREVKIQAYLLEVGFATLFSGLVTVGVLFLRPGALGSAAPILVPWVLSPYIAYQISRPLMLRKTAPISQEDMQLLRLVARRTWSFFEQYVGPEDHWLPPDNYQVSPGGLVAHRTSPTNIGLLITSTLAAYDFGYLDQFNLASRLTATIDTLSQLERFRGHFLNWYDTRTLQPLGHRYVSTVDSGNLAAALIVLSQACQSMVSVRVFRWERWEGYLDTLALLDAALAEIDVPALKPITDELGSELSEIRSDILSLRNRPDQWYEIYQRVVESFWMRVKLALSRLVESGQETLRLEDLRELLQISERVEVHHSGIQRTIQELVPWIPLLLKLPQVSRSLPAEMQADLESLVQKLEFSPELGQIRAIAEDVQSQVESLTAKLNADLQGAQRFSAARAWLGELQTQMDRAAGNAGLLLSGYQQIASQAERFVQDMDFRFLYNRDRRVFHIGYNLYIAQLDRNYYDLLASEARIASLIAIGKGDVPQEHWLYLSRPVTQLNSKRALLSWSGTMFEYLMPSLFLQTYEGTLLSQTVEAAVDHQIQYGHSKGVPWGMSESGFYQFDASQNYQYRAFGVPGLGFKRGLGDDLVIAPYASLIALTVAPQAVVQNMHALMQKYNMLGPFGFYEAIDFTTERLVGHKYGKVQSYMAHHQGMVLMALANYLKDRVMVRRMHSHPRVRSFELLLQEQIPYAAPLQEPHAEDVKGTSRMIPVTEEIVPWSVPVRTPIPQVHLLSNGSFTTLLTNSGSGYSQWRGTDLTRWRQDAVLDAWGTFIYLQDLDAQETQDGLWSATLQPVPQEGAEAQVTFFSYKVEYQKTHRELMCTMEVTVPPDDVEIRRINLTNRGSKARRIRLTSYGEVILSQQASDLRHPAFNKLFIESELVPELNLLLFRRRPRSAGEKPAWIAHMLVLEGEQTAPMAYETDRKKFIGRGGNLSRPAALVNGSYLSGSIGATLDPIFTCGQELSIQSHENQRLATVTLAAETRDELIALAQRYQNWAAIERAFQQASISSETQLRRQELSSKELRLYDQMLSALVYPFSAARADHEILAKNQLGQNGLWPFGVSGDFPVLLVQVADALELDLVQAVLQAHRFWRSRRMNVDLVIINAQEVNYGSELNDLLHRLIHRLDSDTWLNRRGGIYLLNMNQMKPEELTLVMSAARVVLEGSRGSLAMQVPGYSLQVPHLPPFVPVLPEGVEGESDQPLAETEPLLFKNGYGGFSRDGREYVIDLKPGLTTPAPWVNVIGYPNFGFLVSEAGSGCTWKLNSGENRLTPWSNDPVSDPGGEVLYLRDEETGEVWSPTPLPAGGGRHFRVHHGAGYTSFEHSSHGLLQHLTLFASPEHPVKIIRLRLENTWARPRRITATQYIEWVLGTQRQATQQYIQPSFDPGLEALFATNPYHPEHNQQVAFLAASKRIHGLTADRVEFLGRNGSMARPAALERIGPEDRVLGIEDPCAALQVHVDLPARGAEELYFLLGEGDDANHATQLVERFHDPVQVEQAWQSVHEYWDHLLCSLQVRTPDPGVDLILNRWLLYQALSCRIWGRTAFYQSSGAFGFRDQLQDVLSILPVAPDIARQHILYSASHQFEEGDVLHWWHPPNGRGVRTRFSDDLLWLPFVTSEYIRVTGDRTILDEKVPFRQAPVLRLDEEERYGTYSLSPESYTLLEHCQRAIEKGTTEGPHGIPLFGAGDWNDGMNRVGIEGKGESVWLGWFLYDVLHRFAGIVEECGDLDLASRYRTRAGQIAKNIEQNAWDGEWYRRGYYDDGGPLGSVQNMECQIDSIAQSWAVISGGGDLLRRARALQAVIERLVRWEDRLILLFAPPFDQTRRDPGYIKGYVPGIRENGGQYTHAAIWTAWAVALGGQGGLSGRLFELLNPIYHTDTHEKVNIYQVEPYVIAADVYSSPAHTRRGGWTWYTGSSGWMYRLGMEALLGFRIEGNQLRIDPVIPSHWDGFEIDYRYGTTCYHIRVENPHGVERGVASIEADGARVNSSHIHLEDKGGTIGVVVRMGIPLP